MDAATHVLIEDGYGGFSMRKVADKAGISVGNLTYHFPTRAGLIHAAVRQVYGVFESRLEMAFGTDGSPVSRLEDALLFVLEWGSDEETLRFQRESWALASHDPVVKFIVDRFYEDGIQGMSGLFSEINPDATEDQLKNAVTAFALFSEGTPIMNSRLYPGLASPAQFKEEAKNFILRMLGAPEEPEG